MKGFGHRGKRSLAGRLGTVGLLLVTVGGALVASAVAASATASISFTQSGPLGPAPDSETLKITGSGFTPNAIGGLFECSNVTPQPTIDVTVPYSGTNYDVGQIPVSCSGGQVVKISSSGAFPKNTEFVIGSGVLGPPNTGTDSTGGDATSDANNFPCPPPSSSASCELLYQDAAGDTASQTIQFSFQSTTTSTTAGTTSTTSASCTGKSASETVNNPKTGAAATVTVDPATCLVAGETVTVTGQNLAASSIGSLLECNASGSNALYSGSAGATVSSIAGGSLAGSDLVGVPDKTGTLSIVASGGNAVMTYTGVTVSGTNVTFTGLSLTSGQGTWTVASAAIITEGQPTVTYLGNAIPVSCTKVAIFTTTSTGGIAPANQSFTIVEGTTGPPATGTDSNGGDAATDAANYPCPPTAAQTAAGVTCVIAVGDLAGDKVPVPISFNTGGTAVSTTTTTSATTGTTGSGGSGTSGSGGSSSGGSGGSGSSGSGGSGGSSTGAVTTSSSSLAFTGPGPVMVAMGLVGAVFVVLGLLLLVLVDAPRRVLYATVRQLTSRRGSTRGSGRARPSA